MGGGSLRAGKPPTDMGLDRRQDLRVERHPQPPPALGRPSEPIPGTDRAHVPPVALLQDELTDLALPCTVSGMKEPLVLGISGKPQGLQVSITIPTEGAARR